MLSYGEAPSKNQNVCCITCEFATCFNKLHTDNYFHVSGTLKRMYVFADYDKWLSEIKGL